MCRSGRVRSFEGDAVEFRFLPRLLQLDHHVGPREDRLFERVEHSDHPPSSHGPPLDQKRRRLDNDRPHPDPDQQSRLHARGAVRRGGVDAARGRQRSDPVLSHGRRVRPVRVPLREDARLGGFQLSHVLYIAGGRHQLGLLEHSGGVAVLGEAEQGLRDGGTVSARASRQKQQTETF